MVYERVASVLPKSFRKWFQREVTYVGIKIHPERFVGFIFSISLLASFAVAVIAFLLEGFNPLISFPIALLVILGGSIYVLNAIADKEGKLVEKILPDALQLIASNIKAGLTTERALIVSAQPEFGSFSEELKETSKRILSGERMENSLLLISKHIKSTVLDRTMWLIAQGIRSGGQIASLLTQLGADLREENALKSEITANISMYVMLIFFSAVFGAPMLFGVSSYLVGVLSSQSERVNITPEQIQGYASKSPALGMIGLPQTAVGEDFIVMFTEVALFFTSIFACLVLGIISAGHEKNGIKFIPIVLIIAFGVFFATRIAVQVFLGGKMFF